MWLLLLLVVSIVFIVLATTRLKLHPFLALLITAFGFGILSGMPLQDVVKSVNDGFGGTIGYIGIVILAGSIIGTFLEKSGGAYRLATESPNRFEREAARSTRLVRGRTAAAAGYPRHSIFTTKSRASVAMSAAVRAARAIRISLAPSTT